jgi:hypothetical protein
MSIISMLKLSLIPRKNSSSFIIIIEEKTAANPHSPSTNIFVKLIFLPKLNIKIVFRI